MPDGRTDEMVIFAGPKSKLPDGTGGQAHFGKTDKLSAAHCSLISIAI